MIQKFFFQYKIHLLLSITIFILVLAATTQRDALQIVFIFLGSILGTFVLELDYFLYAYFIEPTKGFSQHVRGYVKHNDYTGALNYIWHHKNSLKDKTLNSALFQIVFGALVILTMPSGTNMLLKALILSTFANSIYRMSEEYFSGRINTWFWSLNTKPSSRGVKIYTAFLVVVLIFALTLL